MTPDSFLEPEITLTGGTIAVSGVVTHRTVVKIWQDGLVMIKNKAKQLSVDLGGLTQCDSSGLALCTAWSRAAHQHRKTIEFVNVPVFVQDLLKVYGLDRILSIQNGKQRSIR